MISIRPAATSSRQAVEIVAVVRVQPLHQRAAGVQPHLQLRIALEDVEKRPVAVLVRLLEDVVEVADRLMVVQDEDEADGVRHRRDGSKRCESQRGCRRGARHSQVNRQTNRLFIQSSWSEILRLLRMDVQLPAGTPPLPRAAPD